jgi:hypothetical protein
MDKVARHSWARRNAQQLVALQLHTTIIASDSVLLDALHVELLDAVDKLTYEQLESVRHGGEQREIFGTDGRMRRSRLPRCPVFRTSMHAGRVFPLWRLTIAWRS